MRQQLYALDGLRGIAALSILQLHCANLFFGNHLANSYLAVDVFFWLSGFVLAYSYEEKIAGGLGVRRFMGARAIRLRAITEAAQSRITTIAAARDDLEPAAFAEKTDSNFIQLLAGEATRLARGGLPLGTPLTPLLDEIKTRLKEAEIGPVVAVHLGGTDLGISVVKVLTPGLEDWGVNLNWRPGERVLRSIISPL